MIQLVKINYEDFMKKSSFTLAETLITLIVIGVTAALTVPTMLAKYQHKVLETQFKKNYSLLQNAVRLMVNDKIDIHSDALQGEGAQLRENFALHLQTLHSYLPNSELCTEYYLKCNGSKRGNPYKNYTNDESAHIDADSLTTTSVITPDGAMIWMSP